MELKKHPEANLEKSRLMYFLGGTVFALAFVLLSFEYTKPQGDLANLGKVQMDQEEEEMIPITQQEPPPPPPPPPPQQVIEIVEDDEEIEEELEIEDTEIDEDTEIEFVEVQEEEVVEEDKIFMVVEEMPSFPSCKSAKNEQERQTCTQTEIFRFLQKNLEFPKMARDAGISGVVYVTFVINKKGKVDNVKLLRGIGGGCDEAAIAVVNKMPKWVPGKQRGKPVSVQYNLPIRFTLK